MEAKEKENQMEHLWRSDLHNEKSTIWIDDFAEQGLGKLMQWKNKNFMGYYSLFKIDKFEITDK